MQEWYEGRGLRRAARKPGQYPEKDRDGKIIIKRLQGREIMGKWLRLCAVAAAAVLTSGAASAQSPFPSKPVHIFVPYAAGGAVDILARTLGDVVSRQWGHGVVVEN